MRNHRRASALLVVPLLYFMIANQVVAEEQAVSKEQALPQNIQDALELNAQSLSPIAVSWTQQIHPERPAAEFGSTFQLPRSKNAYFAREQHRVAWQDGKIYRWFEVAQTDADGDLWSSQSEFSSDGEIVYGGSPGTKSGSDTVIKLLRKDALATLLKEKPGKQYFDNEYFDAVGLRLPRHVEEMHSPRAISTILRLLEDGGELASVEDVQMDGHKVTRVRVVAENSEKRIVNDANVEKAERYLKSSGSDEAGIQTYRDSVEQIRKLPSERVYDFYLDPKLDFAVRRREELYEPDTLLLRCDCDEFEQLRDRNVWLPRVCSTAFYAIQTMPGRIETTPIISRRIDVSEIGLDSLPAEQFALNYTDVGTLVADGTLPEAQQVDGGVIHYVVPASPDELDGVIERARSQAEFSQGWRSGRGKRSLMPLMSLNLVALGLVAGFVLWRWRKKQQR